MPTVRRAPMLRSLALSMAMIATVASFAEATRGPNYAMVDQALVFQLAHGDWTEEKGKRVATLSKGEKVEVMQIQDGWARITPYQNGANVGMAGQVVARWVRSANLSPAAPR